MTCPLCAGDFAAIKAEAGAIRLFNSGAFANNKVLQKEVAKTYAEVRGQSTCI
jgi:hypothetical protein